MIDKILYKNIKANTQISTQPCFLVGAELHHTGTTDLYIYDEADATSSTANRLVVALKGMHETIMFPLPGIKCEGLYVTYLDGTGIVYYYYEK